MREDFNSSIHSSPTSFHTAELSDIVLSETPRTKTVFAPVHVDNPNDMEKQLKGSIIFQKPKQDSGEVRITRRDIHSGEYVELSLDTGETYNLANGLAQYLSITKNRMTALSDVTYVPKIPDDKIANILRSRPKIVELLDSEDFAVLDAIMRVREIKELIDGIRENLENNSEEYWQSLFEKRPWIISQVFALPYMVFESQPYVGGKSISDRHGRFPDFLYRNNITGNVAIVEIKTPVTSLMSETQYRDGVFAFHKDTSGAISQLLMQRDTLYKQYSALFISAEEEERFEALNFNCILICGNVSALDSKSKRRSLELLRGELRNITVIGYDELLQKLETMYKLMATEGES